MTPIPRGITITVPVYNSEGSVGLLVEKLAEVLPGLAPRHEVILVNDGSRDRSWQVVEDLCRKYSFVRGINLMRNYGQHNALLCAIRVARYDTIVTMDDDLQHPPEELHKLLALLTDDVDVVYGPPEKEQHGFLRDAASIVTKIALQSAMGAETARMVCALRVFRTQLREAFSNFHSPYVNLDVLLTWGTRRFTARRVRHEPRTIGVSTYTTRALVRHALNLATGFSVVPLQIASIVGFGFTFFGFSVLAYVLIRYFLEGSPVAGFPFLASIIAIFSGAQLFSLGIMGEYLARMHFRLMNRPTYTVRDQASAPPGETP
jgi:glycosyltransferase involved in cell wall biosynthesis